MGYLSPIGGAGLSFETLGLGRKARQDQYPGKLLITPLPTGRLSFLFWESFFIHFTSRQIAAFMRKRVLGVVLTK